MPLKLQEIDPEVDFPAIARCMFESYESPPQKFFHVFFPTHGTGHEAREAAIDEAATRLKLWHTHDPSSYWQKVVDTETGKIAGGSLWKIHKENPFANPPPSQVTWFPDDGSRTYVEKALERHSAPRARVAQKPHLYLFIIFTHPDYRRKGVGQLFMDWGFEKAEELGFDFYLDSTPYGRPLYEANGFSYIEENINHPQTDSPDEAWKEVEEKVGPFTFWLMWKPIGEILEAKKPAAPKE
ncbi:hypothetical protein J7T55_001452 [Diaporthe amygdali]|uniref:uncharacterized protein n=1 Tax=Phomopsis amygdali TaxID=1214568 RepID=UPI0022FDF539|nr:uncharacterized protein J7T55_001452 [Diaporthe amygdali]KAJ0115044.1 hypothetical protein J7T55_001452 [Diaporthe amygdali]